MTYFLVTYFAVLTSVFLVWYSIRKYWERRRREEEARYVLFRTHTFVLQTLPELMLWMQQEYPELFEDYEEPRSEQVDWRREGF